MRIFTPNKNETPGVANEYSGKTPQHGKRRAFKDGFTASASKGIRQPDVKETVVAPVEVVKAENAAEYVGKAVKSVMSNNFTSDKEEVSTGQVGWKGNVRHSSREGQSKGFHSNQY